MPTHREWGKLKLGAGIQHSVVANYLEDLIASLRILPVRVFNLLDQLHLALLASVTLL